MIRRLLTAVLGMLFVIAVFVFTTLLVALALTGGVLGYAWLWWRSRGQRRRVIEGEYRVVESR